MSTIVAIDNGELVNLGVLKPGLANADHVTSTEIMSGTHALFALDCVPPAVIGHAVLSAFRSMGIDMLVLDANLMSKVEDRLSGLRVLGAGHLDQLQSATDLNIRMEALLQRTRPDQAVETALCTGPLELDLLKRKATHCGQTLALLPTELRLLECLMRRVDQVVTRTMIYEEVWNCHFDPHTNRIDVHVGRLRKKLAVQSTSPTILTVRGAGYRLK